MKNIKCINKLSKYLKLFFLLFFLIFINKKKIYIKRIGIIGLEHSLNIGNNLLKYAISIKLSELGYIPYIVGRKESKSQNLSLIFKEIKYRLINESFNEIEKNDYDILMVNSDQTWRNWYNKIPSKDPFFYDIAFLRFSQNWTLPKFVYGASLGLDYWNFNKNDDNFAKYLLKDFTGISVREKGSIDLIQKHLGIQAELVLDPTLLINKKYYLNLIKNYKNDIIVNNNYIVVYTITNSPFINNYINRIKNAYNYKIYFLTLGLNNVIEKFIYGISSCKGVITDSYHGTLFSIIFNKPFISFLLGDYGIERFNTLKEEFNLSDRMFDLKSKPNINLLEKPLIINKKVLNSLKKKSIQFLKRNLKKVYI